MSESDISSSRIVMTTLEDTQDLPQEEHSQTQHVSEVQTRHDPYAALRFRDFRLFSIGRFVATLGELMLSVAIGWELYERTHSEFALGLVGLVQVIPVIALALPAGQIIDRVNRKRVVLVSQILLVFCSIGLALLS